MDSIAQHFGFDFSSISRTLLEKYFVPSKIPAQILNDDLSDPKLDYSEEENAQTLWWDRFR